MSLANEKILRAALQLAQLKPDKKLSQHFLVDQTALSRIIDVAQLIEQDTVVEIGSGPGVLTHELTQKVKKVIAVETDAEFATILRGAGNQNLDVVQGDFLHYDLNSLPQNYKVVANLPYHITGKIIQTLLSARNKPSSITILVQKEVAERIVAKAPKLSVLALSVQYFGTPTIADIVMAKSFWPVPKVDSAILHIDLDVTKQDDKKLFRLIKVGFSNRRKMLKNNLLAGLPVNLTELEKSFRESKIPFTARAQELNLSDWQKLLELLDDIV